MQIMETKMRTPKITTLPNYVKITIISGLFLNEFNLNQYS